MWCCEELLLHAQHTIFCYNLMQKYFHLNYRSWVRCSVVKVAGEGLRRGSQAAADHLINCGNSVAIFAARHTRGETTVTRQVSAFIMHSITNNQIDI